MKGHHLVILFLYEGGMLVLDVAIIGGGPAALSAALNCRQRNKTVTIFGRSLDSSLLFAAEKVDNYLGLPDMAGDVKKRELKQGSLIRIGFFSF